MKRIVSILIGFQFLAALAATGQTPAIHWLPSSEVRSRQPQAKTLYYFRMDRAILCREVEEDIWTDRRIARALNEMQVVWVDVSDSNNTELVRDLEVFVVPTVLIREGGREAARIERSVQREDYLRLLAISTPSVAQTVVTPAAPPSGGQVGASALAVVSAEDAVGDATDPRLDMTRVAAVTYPEGLVLSVTVAGKFDSLRANAHNLFIDADNDPSTGFRNDWVTGADLLIQGGTINRFSGTEPQAWSWELLRSARLLSAPSSVDVLLEWSTLGIGPTAPLRVWFSTQDDQWTEQDRAPASGPLVIASGDSAAANTAAPSSSAARMTLSDPRGDAPAAEDLTGVEIAENGDWLEIGISYAGTPNYDGLHVFLNPDGDAETGYSGSQGGGADFMIEGFSVYRHNGDSLEWKWDKLFEPERQLLPGGIRFRVPRSRIGYARGTPLEYWLVTTDREWKDADHLPDSGTARFPN